MARRALLFAPYFLPRRRVGSMRPFRFAIHLREFGWEPTIVTISAPDQKLTAKERRLLADIKIVEIDSPFDRTTASESQLGVERDPAVPVSSRRAGRWLQKLDHQIPIDSWLFLFGTRYRKLQSIVSWVEPEVIWATADPWSSLVTAGRLSSQSDIPFIADFRDPWTLSEVRRSGKWRAVQAVDRYAERRVLESAAAVIFVSEQTAELYRRHYSRLNLRMHVIPNSFDPDVFEDPEGWRLDVEGVRKGDCLNIGFFGRFRALSPATVVIGVLSELRRTNPRLLDAVRIHPFGPLTDSDAQHAEKRGVHRCFRQREAVPLERAVSALRDFDLLLVSTEPRREEIIPSKLFDYLATGRPILSLSRNPEVSAILARTRTGVQINDPRAVASLLADCVAAKREGREMPVPFDPQPHEIMRFEARKTTQDLAELFEDISISP